MRIVFATDGSEGAQAAATFLSRWALGPGDTVAIVRVATAGTSLPVDWADAPRKWLGAVSARVETAALSGAPAQSLLAHARETGADLIALGALGTTGNARYLVGSVAERLFRHAHCAVLLARPVRWNLARAIVAVDKSPMAAKVVHEASELPLPASTAFSLVTVLPPEEGRAAVAPLVWSSLTGRLEALLHASLEEADDRLRSLAALLQATGHPVTADVYRGDPASCIAGLPEKTHADLVVLGTIGEGGVERFLLGSVTERVARYAPCSVMVAR